jgi:hypothetical protein
MEETYDAGQTPPPGWWRLQMGVLGSPPPLRRRSYRRASVSTAVSQCSERLDKKGREREERGVKEKALSFVPLCEAFL